MTIAHNYDNHMQSAIMPPSDSIEIVAATANMILVAQNPMTTLILSLWTKKKLNKEKSVADKHFQGHTPLPSKNLKTSSLPTLKDKPPM